MRWHRLALALIPLAVGLVLSTLTLYVAALPNPILYVRVDIGSLALIAGLLLSLLVGIGLAIWEGQAYRCQQRVDEACAQTIEERRRFLQRLDHELKNPLTAIRAGLANLVNGSTPTAQQEAATTVDMQALRLSHLTADLRKLAELETGSLEPAPVDVAQLLEESMALTQEQGGADERHLILAIPQAPWPLPEIPGDWDLLFLATYNLLDNALKFTRPGDTVEVRASEDRTHIVIEVADTGPGIPEDEMECVWEELYRGKGARGVPGSGLGLALTRAIVEHHRGEIRLRSRPGQGTIATMRLPTT